MPDRVLPDLQFEKIYWQSGAICVAGLDEAGRGAWAGPVAAGAVILPPEDTILQQLRGVRDSKQMTPSQREKWAQIIKSLVLEWGVGMASAEEIDQAGILPATRLAMQRALGHLTAPPVHLLIDALRLPMVDLPQTAIIKGDARCLSIAAASVLAKTGRDEWMTSCDELYPGYDFGRHKGYGTRSHEAALANLGPCPIHRRSFRPIRALLETQPPVG